MTYLIVAILAVIQGVVGTGLLVFGTPILLSLNYDYYYILTILLPASLAISMLQISECGLKTLIRIRYWVLAILFVILGVVLRKKMNLDASLLVFSIVVVYFFYLMNERFNLKCKELVYSKKWQTLCFISFVHGFTNMGGLLLTIYAALLYRKKKIIRIVIAQVYFMFVVVQIGTLSVAGVGFELLDSLIVVVIAGLTYAFISRLVFLKINNQHYIILINVFLLIATILMVVRKIYQVS